MKKIGYLFLFLTMVLLGCNKSEDLWDEIDDLKVRMNEVENKISDFNKNIEAIKALANVQTVVSVNDKTESEGFVEVVLSDGTSLKLVKAIEGQAKYPIVSINEEGNWTVSYDSGKNFEVIKNEKGNPVKAEGGKVITPKFNVNGKGFWEISYDGGLNYEVLKDEEGNPLSALTTQSDGKSKFFQNIEEKNGMLHIVMADGKELNLPVLPDVYLKFAADVEKLVKVKEGSSVKLGMEAKGVDEVMIAAYPSNWTVELSDFKEGKAELTVTAPKAMTRAAASNEKDIAILGVSGNYSVLAKIQIEIDTEAEAPKPEEPDSEISDEDDLYAQFNAGKDIKVGSYVINKKNFDVAEVIDVKSGNATVDKYLDDTKSTILFLDGSGEAECTKWINAEKPLVIIGRNASERSKISFLKSFTPKDQADVVLYNLEIDLSKTGGGYLFGVKGNGMNSLVIENCFLKHVNKNLYYGQSNSGIKKVVLANSKIELDKGSLNFFNAAQCKNLDIYEELTYTNNVFYSKKPMALQWFNWANGTKQEHDEKPFKVNITNNTFVNTVGKNVFVKVEEHLDLNVSKNIFWADESYDAGSYMYCVYGKNPTVTISIDDNIAYGLTKNWGAAHGNSKIKEGKEIGKVDKNPFAKMDFDEGLFVPLPEYMKYGVQDL